MITPADRRTDEPWWRRYVLGDPLLLIMGLGYTLEMWHRTVPFFAPNYRTIVFDNRGVGRSDVPAGPYSIPSMAGDPAAVLDSAAVDRAHVFGISMGGMIAQEFALQYPQRVRSLILGCTSHGGPEAALADAEVLTTLAARGTMSADEGVRVMIPFVYDSKGANRRRPRYQAPNIPNHPGLLWPASGHLRLRVA